jgi:hypothetical protein
LRRFILARNDRFTKTGSSGRA